MIACRSDIHFASLGRIPPRTPGRSDVQTPRDIAMGPAKYARIGALYFYSVSGNTSDAIFGLMDIEFSLQKRHDGGAWLETYCVGDGFQTGRTSGRTNSLSIEIRADRRTLATVRWPYSPILCGHLDPMSFEAHVDLSENDFKIADEIYVPAAASESESCDGAVATIAGPQGH
jgi:hypothetical protein